MDDDGVIIAGNGTHQKAEELGLPIKVIETDGTELVVVKRTDLKTDDPRRIGLALADNATTDTSEWDTEALHAHWGMDELAKWDVAGMEEEQEDKYNSKVSAPNYAPRDPQPPKVETLYDDTRTNSLITVINEVEMPDEVRKFLKMAAHRHTVFDYEMIAEYYCHAPKEVQELMEDSALVIIDFNKAIELGFVQLNADILAQFNDDYEG